jgi:hypothetical protein
MNEPQAFVDLQDAGNAQSQLVLQAIARHADWETGACFPSQEALGVMAKCTDRTVREHLSKLEDAGFITRTPRRKENGARQPDLITLVGYKDWITALREGGKVAKPKSARSDDTPSDAGVDPPEDSSGRACDQPEDSSGAPGRQASGYYKQSLNFKGTKDARGAREGDLNLVLEGKGVRDRLRETLGGAKFAAWCADMAFSLPDAASGVVVATTQDRIKARWCQQHFVEKILAACIAEWPQTRTVVIRWAPRTAPQASQAEPQAEGGAA